MKANTIILISGLIASAAFGQQEYSFTHYFETNSFFNAAATGTEHTQNVVGIFRKQWLGADGTPTTGGLLYENELKGYNMGYGGYVFTDKIGETMMTTVAGNYSYGLKFNNNLSLSFGMNAGVDFITTDYGRLIYWDQGDQLLTGGRVTRVAPKIGLGTQLYGQRFYVGLSVPRLVNFNTSDFHSISAKNIPMLASHYYLTGGYRFPINDQFEMRTATLLKYVKGANPQIDLNAMCIYNKAIGLGFGYKSLGFVSGYVQYIFDQTVAIGYSFDFSVNPMAEYARGGTHELMVKYAIKPKVAASKL